jgi:hypothetical protein
MTIILKCWRRITGFIFFRKRELEKYKGVFLLEDKRKEKREGTLFNQLIVVPLAEKRKQQALEDADIVQAITHFCLFVKSEGQTIPSVQWCRRKLNKALPTTGSIKIEIEKPTKRQLLAFWVLQWNWDFNHANSYEYRGKLRDYIRANNQ